MPPPAKDSQAQELLKDLNAKQREAVTHGRGPLLIIAGAGTGKTKAITQRIAYLISSKAARPEEILAVTFTEKAANEMEERVDRLIPYSYSFVDISTFNSFGEKLLRNYALDLGYPSDFKLLDDVGQAIFFRERLFRLPLDYYRPLSFPTKHIQELLDAIKRLKQEDIAPEEYLAYAVGFADRARDEAEKETGRKHLEMARVFQSYQEMLEKEGKIDFEDQVSLVVKLFRRRPAVLGEFQKKYKYILVDEFQDTNYLQFELLKLLAGRHSNLTVVGDDDQSIFRFRGASLSNILNFKKVYPDAAKIVLTRNYRSSQSILDSAYALIQQNNPSRLEVRENVNKRLQSVSDFQGKSIHLLQFDRLSHEADRVAEIIQEKIQEGYAHKDFAVLVRRNADADPYIRALSQKRIPFRFSGSRGLYSRDEVKIAVSFIKAATDFEDSRSLFFLSLSEIYRADLYDLTVLSNYAQKRNLSLHHVFRQVHGGESPADISPASAAKIRAIFEDLLYFNRISSSRNAGQVLYEFLERTGCLKTLVNEGSLEAELKIKNLRLFFDKIKNFSELAEDNSLQSFATFLDVLQEVGDNPATAEAELEEDAVNILTVHKAKGLEFEAVFMVSLVADRFPGRERREKIPFPEKLLKESLPPEESYLEEERRLFYVAMTRAKKFLYLTWARDFGMKRLKKVSPFVLEALDLPKLPDEVLRASAFEEIKRFGFQDGGPRSPAPLSAKETLTLSYFQVDDYLSCPLKYKFRHVLRVPVQPHHALVFGRILHNAIHFLLRKKMTGKEVSEEDLYREYERTWVNEGFLSREHEEARKKAGREALKRFFRREQASGRVPEFLEKSFKWQGDRVRFIGRWDRIDRMEDGAVIVDFKASAVKNQKDADKKASDSLQMDIYALSFLETMDCPLVETQLHFLESDLIGHARKAEKELERARQKIAAAEEGIRSRDFPAKPDWHNCSYCDFKAICPSSYAY